MNKKIIILIAIFILFQLITSAYYGIYMYELPNFASQNLYNRYLMICAVLGFPVILDIGFVFVLMCKTKIQSIKIITIILASLVGIVIFIGFIQATIYNFNDGWDIYKDLARISFYYQIPIYITLLVLFIMLLKTQMLHNYITWLTLGILVYSIIYAIIGNIMYIFKDVLHIAYDQYHYNAFNHAVETIILTPIGYLFLGSIILYLLHNPKKTFLETEEV